jgi:glyoxylase-like metal-dependent hydrolase (beta-lactamase superfamily II)
MKVGDLEFWLITDGTFRLDGGAMFGVIPKPMWEKVSPADDRNRILMAMNSLLIRAAGKWILVETGAGDKWDAKRTDIYAFEEPSRLPEKLVARGVPPEKIDIVVNTHLHFDHCGWNTRIVNGEAIPLFPNARYVVQRGELAHAKSPTDRDRASYFPENFMPMEKSGQWWLLDSDVREIVPGVEVIRAPGHNADMMCIRLAGGGKTVFFTADLVPTAAHVSFPWIMSYDLYPLTTLENKKKWISAAAQGEWLVIFGHEPRTPAGYLRERQGKYELEPVMLDV